VAGLVMVDVSVPEVHLWPDPSPPPGRGATRRRGPRRRRGRCRTGRAGPGSTGRGAHQDAGAMEHRAGHRGDGRPLAAQPT
jgi:hypothetical protein